MKNNQIALLVSAIALFILFLMWGLPTYFVWSAGMHGKAKLRKATYDRQVRVVEAKTEWESAYFLLQRDTVQAWGIAKSNAIIGNSLKNNEPYLYFKWLQTLQEMKGEGQVIYLPGNFPNLELPITEANRLRKNNVIDISDE